MNPIETSLRRVVPHLTVPVATVGHLIALKLLARDDRARPQDYDDLVALLGVAQPGDVELARAASRQIMERGFHRGRELESDLEQLIEQLAEPKPG